MDLKEALKNTGTGDLLRRSSKPNLVITVGDDMHFVWWRGDIPRSELQPYTLDVADVLADDWEYQRKEWTGK